MKEEIVSGGEVCALFDISRSTLSRWVKTGKLSPVNANPHLARQRRFDFLRADVDALLNPKK